MFEKIDRQRWYRWSITINIILFFIVALFLYLLVKDSIDAGIYWGSDSGRMLFVARDIAFLAIALALIFFQFFRNLMTIIRRTL